MHSVLEPNHSSSDSKRMDLQIWVDEGEELVVETDGSSWSDDRD